MKNMYRWLGLQLFAEGDGGTAAGTTGAAAGTGQQAEQNAPDAGALSIVQAVPGASAWRRGCSTAR